MHLATMTARGGLMSAANEIRLACVKSFTIASPVEIECYYKVGGEERHSEVEAFCLLGSRGSQLG